MTASSPDKLIERHIAGLPSATDRAQRLQWCKSCTKQKFDPKRGVLCGLTDEPASFEGRCTDYAVDASRVEQMKHGWEAGKVSSSPGGCLGVLVVLLSIGGILGTGLWTWAIVSAGVDYATTHQILRAISAIILLVAARQLYLWKKLGVYLYLLGAFVQMVAFGTEDTETAGISFLIGALTIGVVIFAAIQLKWKELK